MPAQTSKTPGDGSGTLSYTLASDSFDVESVYVSVDATTATGPVTAELTVRDQSGVVIARKKQAATIPAGQAGSATWALRLDDEGATSAYTTVEDEGVALPPETILNFVGAGVTAADDPANARTTVTIPGGGGGIQFDTFPQAGDWLYVETTNAVDTSPHGYSLEMNDTGVGAWIHTAGSMVLESALGTSIRGSGNILISASSPGRHIGLNASAQLTLDTGNGYLYLHGDLEMGSYLGQVLIRPGSGGFTVFDSAGSAALQVVEVAGVTQYHIKTGAAWVADL